MHRITLIPGDGIGPEVASNVVRIIEATGVEIQWETHYAGAQALENFGETLPQDLLDSMSPQEQRQLDADDLQQLGVPTDEQTTGQLLDYLLAP